jgi:nicotinamide mononucleotide adenylyltransferase
MCSLATELTSNWLMVDAWEGYQPHYQPTAVVLDHFDHQINDVLGGIQTRNGKNSFFDYRSPISSFPPGYH